MLKKWTKLFGLLLCVALLWAVSAQLELPAAAATVDRGTCGDNLTWTLDDQGMLTINGNGHMESDSYYAPWFQHRQTIKDITISEGVTSIGDYAFSECISLQNITIPKSVTSIGEYAFGNCRSLQSITISEGITSISEYAFQYCSSLQSITIPESVTSIGKYAFEECYDLENVYISDLRAWLEIEFSNSYSNPMCNGANLYLNDELLTEVTIPDVVTSIGDFAFCGCNLQSITIPESVTSIGDYAFYGCANLQSITIPESVTSIGDNAFQCCDSLQSITILEGITSIGEYAFSDCISLQSITIPESVTSIGDYAFSYCRSLQSITIPEGITSISEYVFYCCNSLQSITIPEGVTSIGNYAFYYCNSLKIIQFMGSAPTDIGFYSFDGVTADVYTLCTDPSWTEAVKSELGDNLTWEGHLYVDCVYNEDIPCAKIGHCKGCGKTGAMFIPGATDHRFGDYVDNNDATCTQDSTQSRSCLSCGKTETITIPNTATGHRFGDYVNNNNATCTQDSTQSRSCLSCGKTETITIPNTATGHRFGVDSICVLCGGSRQITLNLIDLCSDSWNGCAIKVYGNGSLLVTATVASGSSEQVTLVYDPNVTYTFRWVEGSFSNECGFEILIDSELLISGTGDEYFDGDTIYTLAASTGTVTLSGSIAEFADGDVTLTLTSVDGETSVINASGSYSLTAAPGEYILTVSKANHVNRQYAVTLGSEAVTLDVKIHLIGDIDGNGKVNVGDVAKLNGHIKGTAPLTDEYQLLCANVNGGKLNMGDTAALYAHIRGTKKLY